MTKIQIQHKISAYNNYISSNEKDIRKLDNQLEEFSHIKGKLNDSQNKLYDYRTAQKKQYQTMRNNLTNNRFAVRFSEGMLGCLDGAESTKAHNNISASIQTVTSKINRVDNSIQELKNENRKYRNIISELQDELRQLAIAERN